VFVKDDIILIGYNGTISGFDNDCEDENGETRPEVINAEANVCNKIKQAPISAVGGTVYCTLSPCINCAKELIGGKIARFVYLNNHSDQTGIQLMVKAGINVQKI
jgi:dCMP deaminase